MKFKYTRKNTSNGIIQNGDKSKPLDLPGWWVLLALTALVALAIFLLPQAGLWQKMQSMILSARGIQTVSFAESDSYFSNPYMGAVTFAKKRTSNYEGTIVVGGFTWAEIEKSKGNFDFREVENRNNYHYWVKDQNRQFMLGFALDNPTVSRKIDYNHIGIPIWLYEELKKEAETDYKQRLNRALQEGDRAAARAYEDALDRIRNDDAVMAEFNSSMKDNANIPGVGTFYRWSRDLPGGDVEYQVGFSPNYASPLIIEYHDKVLQAIANRYDNEKTYCIIMGSLGHWGEMHTYYILDRYAAGYYPSKEVASQYEKAYAKYFQNTLVSSRQPREVARDHNFGLHNHAFGHPQHTYDWFIDWFKNGYTCYFTGDSHPAMADFWKTAPSGAEFLSTGDNRFLKNSTIMDTIQQAKDTYLTWILQPWVPLNAETRFNMDKLLGKIGYRFAITEASFNKRVSAGENISITTKWRNGGTAPFYHDWPILVELQNSEGIVVAETVVIDSVRSLFPGTRKTFQTRLETPVNVAPGNYQLWVGIFNPENREAAIQLTLDDVPVRDHMVLIGEVEVSNRDHFAEPKLWLQNF